MSPRIQGTPRRPQATMLARFAAAVVLATVMLPMTARADFATTDIEALTSRAPEAVMLREPARHPTAVRPAGPGSVELAGLAFIAAFAVSILAFGWRDGWFSGSGRG